MGLVSTLEAWLGTAFVLGSDLAVPSRGPPGDPSIGNGRERPISWVSNLGVGK